MRQDHVKEELIRTNSYSDQRSPVKRTFSEAKQTLSEYNSPSYDETNIEFADTQPCYNEYNDQNSNFIEADEVEF